MSAQLQGQGIRQLLQRGRAARRMIAIKEQAEEMLYELDAFKLEVVLIPAPERRHSMHSIRVVQTANPWWYQKFCSDYPSSRKRKNLHFDTKIRRQWTRRALLQLISGKCRSEYAHRLVEFIERVQLPGVRLSNIERVLGQADDIDREEGLRAYTRYREMMQRLAEHYGYSLETVVGAFCALSPNNDYMGNLRSTVTLLKGHRDGKPVELLPVSTYKACRARAWACINGAKFLDFTKGPKTRAFYQNIIDPEDPEPITIDGHMVSVWSGKRLRMKEVATVGFDYERVAKDFRAIAYQEDLRANQLQAITWFTWKRVNNIVYDGQMRLFDREDNWRLCLQPEDIRPF